jgi:Phosphotransferase enzyme family
MFDRDSAEGWIRAHVDPVGEVETAHERPWSTVLRVPVAGGVVWFKACAEVQAFEPRLSAQLFARWPDRVAEVLAHDEQKAWLLLGDAGTPLGAYGNPPEPWLEVLPLYAELQRGEAAHADDHVAHGVPDMRVSTLPERYAAFVERELPLEADEAARLRAFVARFAELCAQLEAYGPPDTIQHDDLHMANVYADGRRLRILDWGDSSIGHPFTSVFVTFQFLEFITKLPPGDPWYERLRDAYLEPWGSGVDEVFELALLVETFAHMIAWLRQRDHLPPEEIAPFDEHFVHQLRVAVGRTAE